ncbi:MAG TPA: molybdenum cofactor guanylyltransferase [Flavobacteriales bacterium]
MMDRQWTGVVLAGGRSSRMGRDKALLPWNGGTLLEHAVERLRPHAREILVIGDPALYDVPHALTIPDDTPHQGPLGGLVTALRHARYVRLLVTGCDMPAVNDRLLNGLKRELDLSGMDVVAPEHDGLLEPLMAAYHKRCIDPFRKCLEEQDLKMANVLRQVRMKTLPLTPGKDGWPADLFRNLNRPEDL